MRKLYIDDIRNPKGKFDKITRSSEETIEYLTRNGCPEFISFDHDLGGDDTSMIIVKWLCEMDMDMSGEFIPDNFTWNIHSANPVGADNLDGYLTSYMCTKSTMNAVMDMCEYFEDDV